MLRPADISIGFLVMAFLFTFLGASFAFPLATYLSAGCYVYSLYLYKKISPMVFACIGLFCLLLTASSPSAYMIAALFPLVGFFFSGENKYHSDINAVSRYALFGAVSFFYVVAIATGFDGQNASHNQLSELVVLAIIAELLYFGGPTRLYILLICASFFVFGNRSSIFLMAAFIKNKVVLTLFLLIAFFFVAITLALIDPPPILGFMFDDGGLLYRSFNETRGDYLNDFMASFNLQDLRYEKWTFFDVPLTAGGFYDLHNSFLTIIVRDSYLGLLKVFLWAMQIFFIPLGIFLSVTLRASFDTFLLGSVNDVVLYALIGRSVLNFGPSVKKVMNKFLMQWK